MTKTTIRDFGGNSDRWAIIVRETGEVSSLHTMEPGSNPMIGPDRGDALEMIKGVPGDVRVGMILKADEFHFAENTWESRNGVHPGRAVA